MIMNIFLKKILCKKNPALHFDDLIFKGHFIIYGGI